MRAKRSFHVEYKRDETNWWVATVPGVPGAMTQGRTIEQARERIREALALLVGDRVADRAQLIDRVKLPMPLRRRIDAATKAKVRADEELAAAQAAFRSAVEGLVKDGFSLRDAGELLGVSRQRIHQVLKTG
jgi:predicted RNase H-like HicB family nuclease